MGNDKCYGSERLCAEEADFYGSDAEGGFEDLKEVYERVRRSQQDAEIQYLQEQLAKIQDCQKPPLPPEAYFPDSPIDMASLLVNAEREREALLIERSLGKPETVVEEKYSLEDLEEIASHIMVYVNRHRE